MNMKTEYLCKSRMKHTLLIGTAMFLISPIAVHATGITDNPSEGSTMGVMHVTQQEQTVKGTVKGQDGLPVIAATVSQKGTNNATITDLDGNFTLKVKGQRPVLVFSYIGYVTTEVSVSDKTFINVVMKEDVETLDEVVVVGYGTMKRKDVTGAVSSVKSSEITKNATSNVMQAIAGKMSGVQVVQNSGAPGGDVSILVRGLGTINDASPLYVIDGVPVSAGMWYLNPNDVESIDVLKDASATAIYGSRGANGVVMVTTKQAQEGHTEINFDYSYGIQHSAKTYKMMNAAQYAALHNEMRTNAGPEYSLNPAFADPESLGVGTDWTDAIFHTAPMQKVNLSILGGNQKISHATSLGYYTQDGIMKNSSFERLSLQSNISSKIASNVTVRANVNLSAENRRNQPVGTVIQNAMRILPSIPIKDENGEYAGPTGNAEWNGNALNPVAIINEQSYRMKGFRMLSNISLEWEIIKGLKFKTTGGAELGYDYNNSYIPKYKWGMNESKNTMQSIASVYEQLYLWDNILNYDRSFGKHKLNAMVGTSYQEYKKESVSAEIGRAHV